MRTPAPPNPIPIYTLSQEGSPELPRRVVDKVLGNLQHFPDSWPLIRFDLRLHKSASYYAIWRRFLHLNEYLRTFTSETANATIDAHARGLTEHLVQFLAEWITVSWPWNLQGLSRKFVRLTFSSFIRKISGSNRSGSTHIKPLCWLVRCVQGWTWAEWSI